MSVDMSLLDRLTRVNCAISFPKTPSLLPSPPLRSRFVAAWKLTHHPADDTSPSSFTDYAPHAGCRIYDGCGPERDGIYRNSCVHAEPLSEYRTGGYQPVHLSDTMHDGRYRIVHKLGFVREGTTWLAKGEK